jgi:hypothetical protein
MRFDVLKVYSYFINTTFPIQQQNTESSCLQLLQVDHVLITADGHVLFFNVVPLQACA